MPAAAFPPVAEQLALLRRGVADLVEDGELAAKLERSRAAGRPLTIKAGFDPSAPDLHLGHSVLLEKMRQFQQFGHRVVFVLGDFTARIGDPSGKKATRPALSHQEIEANLATYERQVFAVLDRDRTVVERNSRWLDPLGSGGLVRLAGRYTLARMMEREDFRSRWQGNRPIAIHELLYPLVQGYDSIALEADVELGGRDQIFNLLVGRDLMRDEGLEPQVVLTVPLLVGLDGADKMSKSLGNAIGLTEAARDIYGKTMSIPDALLWDWLLLLTELPASELDARRAAVGRGELNPKLVKQELARLLVARAHGAAAATAAEREFESVFAGGGVPEEVAEFEATAPRPLAALLADAGLAPSRNEARRLLAQGAVNIDGERHADPNEELLPRAEPYLLKVGKRRFARIRVRPR